MMFVVSTILIFVIVGIVLLYLIVACIIIKLKIKHKVPTLIISAFIVAELCFYLACNVSFPVHSNVYYNSVEEIFTAFNKNDNLNAVIEGENSVMCVGNNRVYYYSKTDKGYQFAPNNPTYMLADIDTKECRVLVRRYLDTNDFYVIISSNNFGEMNVSDNKNSHFSIVADSIPTLNEKDYHYYTCINNFSNYVVTADNHKIIICK